MLYPFSTIFLLGVLVLIKDINELDIYKYITSIINTRGIIVHKFLSSNIFLVIRIFSLLQINNISSKDKCLFWYTIHQYLIYLTLNFTILQTCK